jgi:DNA-binding response OmpR family regulator
VSGRRPEDIRALVVDDEESMRTLVSRVLVQAGYETVVAADGLAAQEAATAMGRVDLLVTDEVMPRMTGHELAQWLRAREPQVKVLYLTGFRDRLDQFTHTLWAGESVLDKPCTPVELLAAISALFFERVRFDRPRRR